MKKRMLILLLALCMVLTVLPAAIPEAKAAQWNWDGWTPISTQAELKAISSNMSGKYYLTSDITLSGTWYTLGSASKPFTGILDGNGYTISGMTLSVYNYSSEGYYGLVAVNEGTIRNLTFASCTIRGNSYRYSSTNVGCAYVGFVAGKNSGTISNCKVADTSTATMTVTGSLIMGSIAGSNSGAISHCTNSAPVTSYSTYYRNEVPDGDNSYRVYVSHVQLGGIAGYTSYSAEIRYCTNTAAVNADESVTANGAICNVGGIAGYGSSIYNCVNSGAITAASADAPAMGESTEVGGIVGSLDGDVQYCENTGAIVGKGATVYIGGIAGGFWFGNIKDCSNAAGVKAWSRLSSYSHQRAYANLGGIAGRVNEGNLLRCYNKGNGSLYADDDTNYFWHLIGGYIAGYACQDSTFEECYNLCTNRNYNGTPCNFWCTALLVGYSDSSTFTDCYYQIYGGWAAVYEQYSTTLNNVKGLTYSNMQLSSSYSGFSFTTDWKMGDSSYPFPVLRNGASHTHTMTSVSGTTATCQSAGKVSGYRCLSGCGAYFRDSAGTCIFDYTTEGSQYGAHSLGSYSSNGDATCTKDGTKTAKCTTSGCTYTDTVTDSGTMLEHTPGTAAKENEKSATCTADGSYNMVVRCTECGIAISTTAEIVPATGHTYGEGVITAPNCTVQGGTTFTCATCGDSYTTDVVPALGHTEEEAVEENRVEATCTEAGSYDMVVYCSVCSGEVSRTAETIPATGHSYGEGNVTAEATCTAEGTMTYTCTVCGDSYTEAIAALGHSYESVVTPSTCTEEGIVVFTCTACGDSYSETIPATGHTYDETTHMCTCGAIGGQCGDNLYWTLDEEGTLTIAGTGKMTSKGWSLYAESIKEVVVADGATNLYISAFMDCSNLTGITIPDTLTSIGTYAFYGCTALTTIELPKNLASIGSNAFYGCSSLKNIVIPEGVTKIELSTFSGCTGLESITIPEGVTSIGSYAFEHCSSLSEIVLPSTVTSIGASAFVGCSELTEFVIPEGVKKIEQSTFNTCEKLASVTIPEGVTTIGDSAFMNCYVLAEIKLPSTVTSIGSYAFYGCCLLKSILIPEGVTTIMDGTFWDCSELLFVTIPGSVTEIQENAFMKCYNLEHVLFTGTEEQWNSMTITAEGNEEMIDDVHHCNAEGDEVYWTKNCVNRGYFCDICYDFITIEKATSGTHVYESAADLECDDCGYIRKAKAISMNTLPTILEYVQFKDKLDVTGGVLQVDYSDGTSELLTITEDMVTGYDYTLPGVQTLTVTHEGLTATYEVTVVSGAPDSLAITSLPDKLSYLTGETLDLTGLVVEAVYDGYGSKVLGQENVTVVAVDMSTAGKKEVVISVDDLTVSFEIFVHGLGDVTLNSELYPESSHNYTSNTDETKTFTYTGASSLTITFDSRSFTEYDTDFVYIYDAQGNELAAYEGNFGGETLTIKGDTFKIRLVSDSSVNKFGYAFASIMAETVIHPEQIVPGKAPTCTESGITDGAICSVCGKELKQQEEVPATGHSYENGFCTVCGAADPDYVAPVTSTITQKGRNLKYEDMIYVIDIFELKDIDFTEVDITTDAGVLVWSIEEFEALNGVVVYDEEHANPGLAPYQNTGFYYGSSDGIFTRDLYKEAYYAGYVKLSDGTYIYSEAKLYSPATYAYNMLGKDETSDETKDLCVALLNYISAAQLYFDNNTPEDKLVNCELTAEQKALNWDVTDYVLAPEIPADKTVTADTSVFTRTGKNLLFEEMISLVSIYAIDDATVANAQECGTIYWTADEFAALNGTPGIDNIGDGEKVIGFNVYRNTAGQWCNSAPAVAPKDMAETQYFILGYLIDADGNVHYSGILNYSFEQYIKNTVEKTSTSAEMLLFAQRLYYYERAAQVALG